MALVIIMKLDISVYVLMTFAGAVLFKDNANYLRIAVSPNEGSRFAIEKS